jgi:hypothetical protein
MKKAAILIIIAGLFVVLAVQHSSGVCITPGPPCHEFWRASAVFAGRVISVTNDTEKWPSNLGLMEMEQLKPDPSTAVHAVFEVSEPFRGVSGSKIEVRTGSRGPKIWTSEALDFRVGQEYIVYAYRLTSRPDFSTSGCTRTRLIQNAAEDLAYARSVATSTATGARIFGKVLRWTNGFPRSGSPASGIQVLLWLGEKNWETHTNAEGDFEFTGMSVGDYQVLLPSGLRLSTSVLDVRGCACVGPIADELDR